MCLLLGNGFIRSRLRSIGGLLSAILCSLIIVTLLPEPVEDDVHVEPNLVTVSVDEIGLGRYGSHRTHISWIASFRTRH